MRITETYRTQARQDILYEQGRTTPGLIVTWTKNSNHTRRRAFDICEDNTDDPYGDLEFFQLDNIRIYYDFFQKYKDKFEKEITLPHNRSYS